MKKKIIFDSLLNIIAAAVPIFILQIVILPLVAARVGNENYGTIITLVSFSTIFSLPLGNVLNNVRLLMNETYETNDIEGDFNILLVIGIIINTIVMAIVLNFFSSSVADTLLIIVFSCFNIIREYLIVTFRIKLDYKGILANNFILGVGYLVGGLLFFMSGKWQSIYIVGSFLSLVYVLWKSDLQKEKMKKTYLFKKTTYDTFILFISTFMKTALTYADKLLLYPLIGPTAVSIYYSASVMGKIISMIITPISGVMLSYLTKIEKIIMRDFIKIVLNVSIVGFLGYLLLLVISTPLLKLLYPQWAAESVQLIPITAATAILGVISSVIHPIILRFNHINWQLILNLVNLIIYVVFAYLFFKLYGLIGFCIGLLLANLLKLLIMIIIFVVTYYKREKLFS